VSQIWLLGGSLVAILMLAGVARLLRLGGGGIASETEATEQAEALLPGFEAERATVGSDGQAALVRGRDGSLALLKLHGVHVAARHLPAGSPVTTTAEGLRIDTGERRFGAVLVRGAGDSLLT
jgi:hypothetical protein